MTVNIPWSGQSTGQVYDKKTHPQTKGKAD